MKRFIDTNVLVYAFDASAPEKQAIALRLGRELAERGEGVISTVRSPKTDDRHTFDCHTPSQGCAAQR